MSLPGESRTGHLFLDDSAVEAVVRTTAVAVDDPDAGAGPESRLERRHQHLRVGDLVVDLQQQDRVDRGRRQLRVVRSAQDRVNVREMLFGGAVVDISDRLGVDVFRVDGPRTERRGGRRVP